MSYIPTACWFGWFALPARRTLMPVFYNSKRHYRGCVSTQHWARCYVLLLRGCHAIYTVLAYAGAYYRGIQNKHCHVFTKYTLFTSGASCHSVNNDQYTSTAWDARLQVVGMSMCSCHQQRVDVCQRVALGSDWQSAANSMHNNIYIPVLQTGFTTYTAYQSKIYRPLAGAQGIYYFFICVSAPGATCLHTPPPPPTPPRKPHSVPWCAQPSMSSLSARRCLPAFC
jgi:hypothetical protein